MQQFPLALPSHSPGFAALTSGARTEGRRVRDVVAPALSEVLGTPARIDARPVPGPAVRAMGVARVAVALPGVSSTATIEVDARLLAGVLGRWATAAREPLPSLCASQLEWSLLALLVLVALDSARAPAVDRLAPRLACHGEAPEDALAVALDLQVGEDRGGGLLLLPPAAVAALARNPTGPPGPAIAAVVLAGAFRQGASSITRDELSALAAGDVLLLDDTPRAAEIVFPGGLTLAGRERRNGFHVEEIQMTEAQAAYPLTLAIELGRVTLTLGELARIEPGSTVPLDLRKDGTVVLRAGERAIARGRLVEVAGALAVAIAEIGPLA